MATTIYQGTAQAVINALPEAECDDISAEFAFTVLCDGEVWQVQTFSTADDRDSAVNAEIDWWINEGHPINRVSLPNPQ